MDLKVNEFAQLVATALIKGSRGEDNRFELGEITIWLRANYPELIKELPDKLMKK